MMHEHDPESRAYVENDFDDVGTCPEPWVLRHPSAAITLATAILMVAQWGVLQWTTEQQRPQWTAVNESIEHLGNRDADIAEYQLEHDRWMREVLASIADAGGATVPDRPPELERAIARVLKIKEHRP